MYEVPESRRSIGQNRFEFKAGGKVYSMPKLQFLPVAAAELMEQGKEVQAILLALDDDKARDAVRLMDGEQIKGLMGALAEASGVEVGESSGSADS